MKLSHWASHEITIEDRAYTQECEYKPRGIWFDVDEDWNRWCEDANFDVDGRKVQHEVRLIKPERLLYLDSPGRLDRFTDEYGVLPPWRKRPEPEDYHPRHLAIDWPRVASEYGGIIIAPYQWERRLDLMWYYGWDCASGCVWDLSAIEVAARVSAPPA